MLFIVPEKPLWRGNNKVYMYVFLGCRLQNSRFFSQNQ